MFQTTKLAEGVSLHIRKTTQFKTVNFSFKWRAPLTTKAAAERAVLSNVLQHSNEKFKKSAEFRSHLDDLYGTMLYFDVSKRGGEHTVVLNVETVNDQYLSNHPVLNDVIDLLQTVIFQPNFENGQFVPSIVEREKQMVIQRIESVFDDKTRYAQQRLTQILRPNHPASIPASGTIETVKEVNPESLTEAYYSMINNDKIDIYVAGDIDVEAMREKIRKAFPFKDRTPQTPAVNEDSKPAKDYVKEYQDMKQGKLHMGFSTPVRFGDPDFPKMQVFNGVFGGYAHSKLFMNVREWESLCYYVSSSYAPHYGLLYVISGIEPKNEKKATDIIFEQLEEIKRGNVTDLELNQTRAMLVNHLREALDLPRGQIDIFDQYKDLDEEFSVDLWKERWHKVTKEDLQEMASLLKHEATYFLCGKEAE